MFAIRRLHVVLLTVAILGSPAICTATGLGGKVLTELRQLDRVARDLTDVYLDAKIADRERVRDKLRAVQKQQDRLIDAAFEAARKDGSVTFTEATLAAHLVTWSRLQGPDYAFWGARAKRSKARCPEPVDDQLLFDLAQQIVEDRPVAVPSTLGRVVQGMECYSMRDARVFADRLGWAYGKTLRRFDDKTRRSARRVLLGSHANLYLIVHDLTKAFGPTALSRVLVDERRALGEVFAVPSSPLRLVGLWLYHPSADRLIQLDPLCEARLHKKGEICVSGAAILDAATRADRLALGNCALAEMLAAHFDERVGYRCQRNACEEAETTGVPALGTMSDEGSTPHGEPLDDLQDLLCPDGLGGGGSAAVGVLGRLGDLAACITETLLAERRQAETQCIADVARRARSPWISTPDEGHEACGDPLAQDSAEAIQERVDEYEAACTGDPVDCAKRAARDLFDRFLLLHSVETDEAGFRLIQEIFQSIRDAEVTEDTITTEFQGNRVVLQRHPDDNSFRQMVSELYQIAMTLLSAIITEEEGETPDEPGDPPAEDPPADGDDDPDDDDKYCAPELGDCGDCSPGEAMRRALLDCTFGAEPTPDVPLVDPRVAEPLPWDDPNDSAWAACIEAAQQREAEAARASMACAHLQCLEGEPRVVDGRCVCDRETAARVPRDDCAFTRCPDDTQPVATPTGCRCQGHGGNGPGVPPGDPRGGEIYDPR